MYPTPAGSWLLTSCLLLGAALPARAGREPLHLRGPVEIVVARDQSLDGHDRFMLRALDGAMRAALEPLVEQLIASERPTPGFAGVRVIPRLESRGFDTFARLSVVTPGGGSRTFERKVRLRPYLEGMQEIAELLREPVALFVQGYGKGRARLAPVPPLMTEKQLTRLAFALRASVPAD